MKKPAAKIRDPKAAFGKIPGRNAGFSLVVTLALMILLTIIAVGLLTLSSVSLRSTKATSAEAIARGNAKLALMLAIGELQRQVGPDQRVTGTADIAGAADGTRLAAGASPANNTTINDLSKGLSPVLPGTRFWTGVWRDSTLTGPDVTTPGARIFTTTPSPTRLQWLVSGNETTASPSFTPASPACTVKADGTVSDAQSAAVLAGRATVGTANSSTIENFVSAPLVGINTTNPAGTVSRGRYAWWVGDEGVKARINIARTRADPKSYASLATQRRGWETVAGFADYPPPTSPAHSSLPKIPSLATTPLLLAGTGASSGGVTPIQAVFHSATADSKGLLVDVLNGGTKIDLTSTFAANLPSSPRIASVPNYPTATGVLVPKAAASAMKAPTWAALKEFYDRSGSLSSGALVAKSAASDLYPSVAPLVIDLRILMGVRLVPSGAGYKINPCAKIAIALANPYSVQLKWNNDIEIELFNQTPNGNRPSRVWGANTESIYINGNTGENAVFNQAIFRIRPASLAAGEARAYTLSGAVVRPMANSNQRVVVDLVPFANTAPFDFNSCVEMETNRVFPSLPPMDVRESWQTTQLGLRMTLAGSPAAGQPLRLIERFELDNGYYLPNTLRLSNAEAAARPRPLPLMCYSFQISQPGMDYINLMPAGYEMGQRGSTLRTFADFNLQAIRFPKPITSYNPPPYFMESNNSISQLPTAPPGGDTGPSFTRNLAANPVPWGRAPNGSRTTVLFAVPSQFTSLAQFQHADLTGDDVAASIGHQPGNAFSNSYATPFVKRSLTSQSRTDYQIIGDTNRSGANQYPRTYYDISYLLNASLWDAYFLSTIPNGSTPGSAPENPNLILFAADANPADLRDPVNCAGRLMVDGAFNVNCTDKNAWKAFLASTKHLGHAAEGGPSGNAAFPRSLEQPSASATPPSGTATDSFSGFRRLSDTEIDALATEIVKQVRLRGPFVSVSHFVNRAIGEISKAPALTRSGALQSAIDESGINISFDGTRKSFNNSSFNAEIDRVTLAEKEAAPRADMDGGDRGDRPADADPSNPDWARTSTDNNFGAIASIIADRTMLNSLKREQGYRSTGIPGWLTQADVLQVIGPSIAARSDTFRIRTCGEALDGDGKVIARAWCEAIVQRTPAYVDHANAPHLRGAELNPINKIHGRQFKIASFRWLSRDEI